MVDQEHHLVALIEAAPLYSDSAATERDRFYTPNKQEVITLKKENFQFILLSPQISESPDPDSVVSMHSATHPTWRTHLFPA